MAPGEPGWPFQNAAGWGWEGGVGGIGLSTFSSGFPGDRGRPSPQERGLLMGTKNHALIHKCSGWMPSNFQHHACGPLVWAAPRVREILPKIGWKVCGAPEASPSTMSGQHLDNVGRIFWRRNGSTVCGSTFWCGQPVPRRSRGGAPWHWVWPKLGRPPPPDPPTKTKNNSLTAVRYPEIPTYSRTRHRHVRRQTTARRR